MSHRAMSDVKPFQVTCVTFQNPFCISVNILEQVSLAWLRLCAGLLAFAERAHDAVEVGMEGEEGDMKDWMTLPQGLYLMGEEDLGNTMYVRRAYRKLAEVLEDMRAAGQRHVVVSGNPGLGKSYFAIWMLIRQAVCNFCMLKLISVASGHW